MPIINLYMQGYLETMDYYRGPFSDPNNEDEYEYEDKYKEDSEYDEEDIYIEDDEEDVYVEDCEGE